MVYDDGFKVEKTLRVLICGSRDWTDYERIYAILEGIAPYVACVIEGEARGADSLARRAAESLGIPVLKFPADWNKHGRAAGPIRNQQMLDEGKPNRVLAFQLHNSSGTTDMIRRAKKAGIFVEVFS